MSGGKVEAVVAIDFGTTYSGYIFSLSGDELNFYSPQCWNYGHGGAAASLKTPTSLLLNPDKTLHSFGFEAEDAFAGFVAADSHHQYYFFQRFKMELQSEVITYREKFIIYNKKYKHPLTPLQKDVQLQL